MIIFTLGFICVIFWLAVMLYGLRTFFQLIFWLCVRPARLLVISALCFGIYYSVTNSDWFASYLDEVHAEQARVAAEPDQTGAPYAVPLSDDRLNEYPLPTLDTQWFCQNYHDQYGHIYANVFNSCMVYQNGAQISAELAWEKLNKAGRAKCLKTKAALQDYQALRFCADDGVRSQSREMAVEQ